LIEYHALNRLLSILPEIYIEESGYPDKFNLERRIEFRFPTFAKNLPLFVQGIENVPASASHLLAFVISHFKVSEALVKEIRKYLQ
jgi:lincosamide nucleotidyltransferase B/F